MWETEENKPVIVIEDVTKQYRLGQIGSTTLQNEIKEWKEARREKKAMENSDRKTRLLGKSFMALNGINLKVYPGEALGIIGKNGAGKSTMLKLLSRITAPTTGRILLHGRVASMLEVGTGFHGEMTGRENVYMNGAILGMKKSEIDAKMDDIIAFAEVEDFIDTPVKRYSSGMYVKLAFSVAAHLDSEIMIMDEVLAVGDMAFQKKCLDKMKEAANGQGKTVLYVSHNMHTIRSLCSRCIVLDEGKIVFDGDVDEAIAVYLGTSDEVSATYTFDHNYRPYDDYIRRNKQFNMLSLEVLDQGGAEYSEGQIAHMRLKVSSEQPLAKVGFRFELWFQDGTKIGSMLSENFADIPQGESTVELAMDCAHLTPGCYHVDLVAYLFDEDGNEDIIDGVYPGVVFRIDDTLSANTHLDWHHQYWGNVHLHNLKLKQESGEKR